LSVHPDDSPKTIESSPKNPEKSYETNRKSLPLIADDKDIAIQVMAGRFGIGTTAVENNLSKLQKKGNLRRIGPAKGGYWEVKFKSHSNARKIKFNVTRCHEAQIVSCMRREQCKKYSIK
jgi:predicted HTH transcriptional regulator